MSGKQVVFGIVGAGGVAQSYARAFENCHITRIAAVADIRVEAASALAGVIGCHSFNSYRGMAEAMKLDAVLVCTPPDTHSEICLYFLERRVHVLCEKPFSVGVQDARSVLDAARKTGMKVAMASKFRYFLRGYVFALELKPRNQRRRSVDGPRTALL